MQESAYLFKVTDFGAIKNAYVTS